MYERLTKAQRGKWVGRGLINVGPNQPSENGVLFTIEYLLLSRHTDRLDASRLHRMHSNGDGTLRQEPWDNDDPSSHDNTTAILGYAFLSGIYGPILRTKIAGEYWHPRDLIFYNYLKGNAEFDSGHYYKGYLRLFLTYPFWPLMIPIQWWSCFKGRETGETTISTSSKLLAWVRCQCTAHQSVVMWLSWELNTWTIKRHKKLGIDTWRKVFHFYFKHPGHPIKFFPNRRYEELNAQG